MVLDPFPLTPLSTETPFSLDALSVDECLLRKYGPPFPGLHKAILWNSPDTGRDREDIAQMKENAARVTGSSASPQTVVALPFTARNTVADRPVTTNPTRLILQMNRLPASLLTFLKPHLLVMNNSDALRVTRDRIDDAYLVLYRSTVIESLSDKGVAFVVCAAATLDASLRCRDGARRWIVRMMKETNAVAWTRSVNIDCIS